MLRGPARCRRAGLRRSKDLDSIGVAREASRLCTAMRYRASVCCRAQAVGQAAKTEKDGKWETADGNPTYNITGDGTVDWYTFSGFRRYHSECHTCHGPDGEGSTYAPGLMESLKTMKYEDFMGVVASGREVVRADKQSKMPALGDNRNVMCYIDDIYVYLKARADGALPRGRPAKRERKAGRRRGEREGLLRMKKRGTAALLAVLVGHGGVRRRPARRRIAPIWSIARRCASAPTRRTCRSRTTRARVSRTRSPRSSPPSSRCRSNTPGFRRPPASSGRPCSPSAATW